MIKKICPLVALSTGFTAQDFQTDCLEEKCCWWIKEEERCVVFSIKENLVTLRLLEEYRAEREGSK